MKLFLYLLLFIVIVAFGLTFSLKNPQTIELKYYSDIALTAPLVVVLLVTLLLGMLLGMLTTLMPQLRRKRELQRAKKEIRKLGKELQLLTPMPGRDPH